MRERRSVKKLKEAIEKARTKGKKANAYYELALFHDNNSRESEAVPLYQKAIKFGLAKERKVKALAWLASSFYKTGNYKKALVNLERARRINIDGKVVSFLARLRKRIRKKTQL